ncbi:MAG: hypothetical protein ABII68_04305 [Pseudomonadota bacterium]
MKKKFTAGNSIAHKGDRNSSLSQFIFGSKGKMRKTGAEDTAKQGS